MAEKFFENGDEINIPDMKELRKKFENRDKHFRDAIEKTGAGYFCISKEGIYVEVNNEWLKMYKYSSTQEITGKHFKVTMDEQEFEEMKEAVAQVLKGETINYGEVKRICKDGSEGYHKLALTPVIIDGNIEGFEGFIIDTTKMFDAEHELIRKLYKTTDLLNKSIKKTFNNPKI